MDQFELLDANNTASKPRNESKGRRTCTRKHLLLLVLAVAALVVVGILVGLNPPTHTHSLPPLKTSECLPWPHPNTLPRSKTSHRWLNQGGCLRKEKPACPAGVSPPLLLISMDGFRADYLARNLTPNIRRLSECGVHTPYMRAVFPSKTFPNHYSIVTGLYPESHGIIDNRMYDPSLSKEMFNLRDEIINDHRWWQGEPIWNTVRKAGKKSATIFWPGSGANIQGLGPNICYNYNQSVKFEDRVGGVLRWLDQPPDRWPHFMTLYVDQPDSAGHKQGPFGDWVNGNLTIVDTMIGQLMDGLLDRNLDNCINLILLADHGMAGVDCDHVVVLSDYLNTSSYQVYDGVFGRLSSKYVRRDDGEIVDTPNGDSAETILAKLKCGQRTEPTTLDWYVRLLKKEDLPKRFHYSNNRRIDDIVITVEKDYQISRDRPKSSSLQCYGGNHGYDNTYNSMHALFLAHGPSFKQNFSIKPFESIELYNLMADLLNIKPAPNNGTEGSLRHLLRNPSPLKTVSSHRTLSRQCHLPDKYDKMLSANHSDCHCDNVRESSLKDFEKNLVLEETDVEVYSRKYLPLGLAVQENLRDICQLTQRDYVTVYSQEHKMLLVTAFTLSREQVRSKFTRHRPMTDVDHCIVTDPRVSGSNSVLCSLYRDKQREITPVILHPASLLNVGTNASFLSSNLVPMYENFKNGVWDEAMLLLEEYAEKYARIHVMLGPIFDENSDGHHDLLAKYTRTNTTAGLRLPTHFYIIAMKCSMNAHIEDPGCSASTDVFSVILPHNTHIQNCLDRDLNNYIRNNVARIKDVELLTGLKFLQNVPIEERVSMETHLEVGLWDRISWADETSEDGCPLMDEAQCPQGYNLDHPPLLLVSIDGFRPDYLKRNLTPTLQRLFDCGTSAPYMRPVYPSITFPNHYTIVTGLYPESHGIIDNAMYDTKHKKYFKSGDARANNPTWWHGEPIWNTLVKENKTAVTIFWVGSAVTIQGLKSTKNYRYNGHLPYSERVKLALSWLNGSQTSIPSLVTLYFEAVDKAGHVGGASSLQVSEALQKVETAMKQLMDGLHRQNLHKCVNIIVVSDHGMADVSCNKTLLMSKLLGDDYNKVFTFGGSAGRISNKYVMRKKKFVHIPKNKRVPNQRIVNRLSCQSPHLSVFDKRDAPRRLHYSNNHLIDDVLLLPDEPWLVDSSDPPCPDKGSHGYDPFTNSMHALFLGYGPSFKRKMSVAPFENIELYNLMADLTNSTAAPNNGTRGSLYHLLRHPPTLPPLDDDPIAYTRPPYPDTQRLYEDRTVVCYCHTALNESLEMIDRRLNPSDSDVSEMSRRHLPQGMPLSYVAAGRLLWHNDYVSAYDEHITLWTAFQLNAMQMNHSHPLPNCLRADVRLKSSQQPSCDDLYQEAAQTITYEYPFSPDWSTDINSAMDALLLSNIVPMDKQFKTDVWQPLQQFLAIWTRLYGRLNIITGPVFDYDVDGSRDRKFTHYVQNTSLPLPSHYFLVAFKCPQSSCEQHQVLSFVLPNHAITNCMDTRQYLRNNLVRLRDIELLTGLHFLTKPNYTQQSFQTRTYIPTELWPTEPVSLQ